MKRGALLFAGVISAAAAVAAFIAHSNRNDPDRFAMAIWKGPAGDGNYEARKNSRRIEYLVLYATEHPATEALSLWTGKSSVSGHYIVTSSGEVWQCVADQDIAFHAGNKEFNDRSISVALEGYSDVFHPQNRSYDCSWQTPQQAEALRRLALWLTRKYDIPIDRTRIIGKNQVPAPAAETQNLLASPFWGGKSHKFSPGPTWNWTRFMASLGMPSRELIITVDKKCEITTFPAKSAVITYLWPGQKLVAYAENADAYLVYVAGTQRAMPDLSAGQYHWDGWISKGCCTTSGGAILESGGAFPRMIHAFELPRSAADLNVRRWEIAPGKLLVATGAKAEISSSSHWIEVYLPDAAKPTTAWIERRAELLLRPARDG